MTAPTQRHRHQIALAAASNLFTNPVPDCFRVSITHECVIEIMPDRVYSDGELSLDRVRVIFHRWAALLDEAQRHVKPHDKTRRNLSVVGTWLGQTVKIWQLIPADGPDLAELSTRPELDTVAGAL